MFEKWKEIDPEGEAVRSWRRKGSGAEIHIVSVGEDVEEYKLWMIPSSDRDQKEAINITDGITLLTRDKAVSSAKRIMNEIDQRVGSSKLKELF